MERYLGRVERDTGCDVREKLFHVWSVVCGLEEGAEGRARVNERGVTDRGLQHGPEIV